MKCLGLIFVFSIVLYEHIECALPPPDDAFLSMTLRDLTDDLYKSIIKDRKKNDRIVISPFGISTALALLLPGAVGETAREIRQALHYSETPNGFMAEQARKVYAEELSTKEMLENKKCGFTMGNILGVRNGTSVFPKYLTTVKDNFLTSVTEVNESERNITGIGPNGLAANGMSVLSYVLFTATFNSSVDKFYRFNIEGYKHIVFKGTFKYARNTYLKSDFQIVDIPYMNGRFSLIFILPENGVFQLDQAILDDYKENKLDSEIFSMKEKQDVLVTIPESILWSKTFFLNQLKKAATEGEAEFPNISRNKALYVQYFSQFSSFSINAIGEVTDYKYYKDLITQSKTQVNLGNNKEYIFVVRDNENRNYVLIGRRTNK